MVWAIAAACIFAFYGLTIVCTLWKCLTKKDTEE